ncbi:MAG: hypothetical protein GDA38_12750 [Hormoscilla sp. SP12CHS1]|nr:hypothetical protein [Hormoscilla sp. SP12CHS1]
MLCRALAQIHGGQFSIQGNESLATSSGLKQSKVRKGYRYVVSLPKVTKEEGK